LVQETLKNGLSFYFEYAGQGPEARCTRTWGDEGIYDHKLDYDLDARRTVVTNSLGYATTYLGNENGLVVEMQDARGGVTRTEYTKYNEILSETDTLGLVTIYTYDERGNCLTNTAPDGSLVERTYDAQSHLTQAIDAVGGRWQWTHDATGNLLTQTNALGNKTTYLFANGQPKKVTDEVTHLA
jgi:YD repeat-containing protein